MEGNMVDDYFDNVSGMDALEAIELIEEYFKNYLSNFRFVDKYHETSGYWGVEYTFEDCIVKIESGRGILEPSVYIQDTRYSLSQYDKRMVNIRVSSKKNILFTLDIIKDFFKNI